MPWRAFVPTSRRRDPPRPMMIAFCDSRSTKRFTRTSSSGARPFSGSPEPSRSTISSTTTASECGSSSRTPSSAASRTSSATMICSGSSVSSPPGYSSGPSGRKPTSTSSSVSTWYPPLADTGTMADHSTSCSLASWSTAMRCSARRPRSTRSALVTTATTGRPRRPPMSAASWFAMNRSPGPTFWSAGRQNAMTSTSPRVSLTRSLRRWPSSVRGRCRPGVSTRISWASSRCTMPRMVWRVVCGRADMIATFSPTRAFVRVDLPALGRPTRQAKPERCGVCVIRSPSVLRGRRRRRGSLGPYRLRRGRGRGRRPGGGGSG